MDLKSLADNFRALSVVSKGDCLNLWSSYTSRQLGCSELQGTSSRYHTFAQAVKDLTDSMRPGTPQSASHLKAYRLRPLRRGPQHSKCLNRPRRTLWRLLQDHEVTTVLFHSVAEITDKLGLLISYVRSFLPVVDVDQKSLSTL